MSRIGNSDFDALTAALDALNSLQVALTLVSEHLAKLQRATSYCDLRFARDGSLEGASFLPTSLASEGEPLSEFQMDDIRFHCKWLAEYIDSLWQAHAIADRAILGLPRTLIKTLDALTGSPWVATVRRNCLDLVLKWPGETHHQTSYAATKVFGRADELLKKAKDSAPFAAWSEFDRLLATYRHDLFAVRDAAQNSQPAATSVESAHESDQSGGQQVTQRRRKVDPATDARDKWIYERCVKLVAYDVIARKLREKPKTWPRISTKQGIRQAAERYAARHGLEPIPARQE
jgi:hypothetical protein